MKGIMYSKWLSISVMAVALVWAFLSLRPNALVLSVVFLAVVALHRGISRNPYLVVGMLVIVVCWPLQPFEVTLINAVGAPHFIGHCNIRGPDGIQGALKDQTQGNCLLASDVTSGFEASRYLVW